MRIPTEKTSFEQYLCEELTSMVTSATGKYDSFSEIGPPLGPVCRSVTPPAMRNYSYCSRTLYAISQSTPFFRKRIASMTLVIINRAYLWSRNNGYPVRIPQT
jgi:hypothetical protein